ncbi:NAD-dependent epimerase/dehydratase family protein [Kutzneria viridogrisea]|uniref:UDP-glucose 4-epimerase n=1 Tax=Kutzneria viridogrisea TaxID=47990 RepID=A0ABR6BAJ1_9PSEU|nr:UDP-glucose 4-epimerase [Kutzneria viridogrisea]
MADSRVSSAPRRALILGAAGFLGSHLATDLHGRGWRVTGLVRDLGSPVAVARLAMVPPGVVLVQGDATDRDLIDSLVRDAEVVYVLTGGTEVSETPKDLDRALRGYLGPTMTLLEVMRAQNSTARAVFVGSRLQYGIACQLPVPEHHPLAPISWYANCKTFEDNLARTFHAAQSLDTCRLRVAHPYGPWQRLAQRPFGIVGIFLDLADRGEPIPLYGGGRQILDFVHVRDVTAAMAAAATSDAARGEVFNIGGARPVTLRTMADTVVEVVGPTCVHSVDWPPRRRRVEPGDFWADVTKARRLLGWQPTVGLRAGLADTWLAESAAGSTVSAG